MRFAFGSAAALPRHGVDVRYEGAGAAAGWGVSTFCVRAALARLLGAAAGGSEGAVIERRDVKEARRVSSS